MDIELPSYTLNLVCKGIGNISSIASSVLEDHLTDLVVDYQDNTECEADDTYDAPLFNDQVRECLFDVNGKVRVTGSEDMYWAAVEEPEGVVEGILDEINANLRTIVKNNHERLLHLSENYLVKKVTLARQFPDLWVLRIEGAPL